MAGDNPGPQAAGDNPAAARLAHEIEASVRTGHDSYAYQHFAQEVQGYRGNKEEFVQNVLQQFAKDGYHLPEMRVVGEQALRQSGQPGASSSGQMPEAPQHVGPPVQIYHPRPIPKGYASNPSAFTSTEVPSQGAATVQPVYRNELPPERPQAGKPAQHPSSEGVRNETPAQAADRIAREALQVKKQHGVQAAAKYIKDATIKVYREHAHDPHQIEWLTSQKGSFNDHLNKELQQEHIWQSKPGKHVEHAVKHPVKHVEHHYARAHEIPGRVEHAHQQPMDKVQLKQLEKEGKIERILIKRDPHHPKAKHPLKPIAAFIAKRALPSSESTKPEAIKHVLKDIERLNGFKPRTFVHGGETLLVPTKKFYEKPETVKPAAPATPAEATAKPAAPATPPEAVEPAPGKAFKNSAPELVANPAITAQTTLSNFYLRRGNNPNNTDLTPNDIASFKSAIYSADKEGKSYDRVWTRIDFISAVIDAHNQSKYMNDAQTAASEIKKIDPKFFEENQDNSDFKAAWEATGILPPAAAAKSPGATDKAAK